MFIGIDAILVETYQNTPILVRVQKSSENITESAQLLLKAMKVKKSKKSILIQTESNGLFDEVVNFDGITLLKSPAFLIKNSLDN